MKHMEETKADQEEDSISKQREVCTRKLPHYRKQTLTKRKGDDHRPNSRKSSIASPEKCPSFAPPGTTFRAVYNIAIIYQLRVTVILLLLVVQEQQIYKKVGSQSREISYLRRVLLVSK